MCVLGLGWSAMAIETRTEIEGTRGLDVALGEDCLGIEPVWNNRSIVVSLEKGKIDINDNAMLFGELGLKMRKIMKDREEKLTFVTADDESSYGDYVDLVDSLHEAVPDMTVVMIRDWQTTSRAWPENLDHFCVKTGNVAISMPAFVAATHRLTH